jgi:hypothetical protein
MLRSWSLMTNHDGMVVQAGESVGERGLGDRALRRRHQRSLGRRDIAGELVVKASGRMTNSFPPMETG